MDILSSIREKKIDLTHFHSVFLIGTLGQCLTLKSNNLSLTPHAIPSSFFPSCFGYFMDYLHHTFFFPARVSIPILNNCFT